MVAFPHVGAGPYGTSSKSARSSTTDTSAPKLDATEIEHIFENMNASQERVTPGPSNSNRFSWFSRQWVYLILYSYFIFISTNNISRGKKFTRRGKSVSESK